MSALKKRSEGIALRTIGRGNPACTGISGRPISSSTESELVVVAVSGALPNTVVTPIRSTWGCRAASIRATASSVPVSQSMINLCRPTIGKV